MPTTATINIIARNPKDFEFQSLYMEAVVGYGNQKLGENAFDQVIDLCQKATTDLGISTDSINQLQSAALVQKGYQSLDRGDPVHAEKIYRKALSLAIFVI